MIILCLEICIIIFYHFKYFCISLFYCIQLNFLILFPMTLDIYFYLLFIKNMKAGKF